MVTLREKHRDIENVWEETKGYFQFLLEIIGWTIDEFIVFYS